MGVGGFIVRGGDCMRTTQGSTCRHRAGLKGLCLLLHATKPEPKPQNLSPEAT